EQLPANQLVRCDDLTSEPRFHPGAPNFQWPGGQPPMRSFLAAPVVSRNGNATGRLLFWHSQPGRFTPNHAAALKGIASHPAIPMDNARLFQQAESAQNDLRRFNEELRRANQDLEIFAYSASHDLQEPLRTVALCAQLLDRNLAGRLEKDDQELLNTV